MCIFTQPVISVNNTRIFARLSGRGTQFLAYQMHYESPEPNAMVLPLPVRRPARDDSLRFIDLKHYDDFFDDLDAGFPYHSPVSFSCSASFDAASRAKLEVFNVGNYVASFVPTLSDFDRLDSQFKLPTETWAKLPACHAFGFAVFQLAAGSLKPHPMAFEYRTDDATLFFPTVHIHDGAVHDTEDFDHVLYAQHAGWDSIVHGYGNADVEDPSTHWVRSKHRAAQFCPINRASGLVLGDLLLHRKVLRGRLPNTDTIIAPSGDPLTPSFNPRPLLSYAPWLVGLAFLAWFFHRRSKNRRPAPNVVRSRSQTPT
jgi:hypothetical protein